MSATRVIDRAFGLPEVGAPLGERPIHLVAVGKAAPAMATALMTRSGLRVQAALAIGTHPAAHMPASLDFIEAGHPFPDARSRAAAAAALDIAKRVSTDGHLVLLVSGGASALMADAVEGVSFAAKLEATRGFMLAGADIHQLNALRKHLSRVKGGRLAAACAGRTTSLALSDVVGDDLSVIGSGPGVPDVSTWLDVAQGLNVCRAWTALPLEIRARIEAGCRGTIEETPKPGDPRLAHARGHVIGSAAHATEAARVEAEALGYHTRVLPERVTGEARDTAPGWLERCLNVARELPRPTCILSAGETTVRVEGDGVGGRNLEFALALVEPMQRWPGAIAASVGTDGIDGSSDVAGAVVAAESADRARARGLAPAATYLDRNDSFNFFDPLGDTIRTGRTETNVGDLQVLLIER